MNDSLYQISIESQAMKDKLKTQEKNLKNNYSMLTELKRKSSEYKHLIKFSEDMVVRIEESFSRLENNRNLFSSLHERTVLKNCLLVWRTNSQKQGLEEIIERNKLTSL